MTRIRSATVVLNETSVYRETVEIREIPALSGCVEVCISSYLRTAMKPDEPQVKYRSILPEESLRKFSSALLEVQGAVASERSKQ